ncbi:GNAT family N-acetyltransferase [Paenibacillus sp. 22594]|uniref:GNAT family N-acetyltransferase n=1 Tax=Paenibacillus sp. 22594 TaxID=3453947 RepID=UPI003F8775DE
MITELPKADFYKIKHLTDACCNIEVKAIVGGNNPGWVFADDPAEPKSALIWIQGQTGFHLVGDPQSEPFLNGLEAFMQSEIESKLTKLNMNWVEISCESESWRKTIEVIFNKRKISNSLQHVFKLGEALDTVAGLSSDAEVHRMDKSMFETGRISNQAFIEEKLARFWDSPDHFFQQGVGYFVERDHKAVSVCFSAFITGHNHAVDIETIEGYRNRNYAASAARAFVEECRRSGIQPYRDCSPDNSGSIRLAEMMGLVHDFDYRIFWYNF